MPSKQKCVKCKLAASKDEPVDADCDLCAALNDLVSTPNHKEHTQEYLNEVFALDLRPRLREMFAAAKDHQKLVDLVWAYRALIDDDAKEAPFFTVEYVAATAIYTEALSLYFEHAQRVLGRSPWPIEVDQIENGFCGAGVNREINAERGKQLLAKLQLAPPAIVSPSGVDLDPLGFWCDLAEVLGHPRLSQVNPVSLIAEAGRRLAPSSAGGDGGFSYDLELLKRPSGELQWVEDPDPKCVNCGKGIYQPERKRKERGDVWFHADTGASSCSGLVATPAPQPVAGKCRLCGHGGKPEDGICRQVINASCSNPYGEECGCECRFTAPPPSARDRVDAEAIVSYYHVREDEKAGLVADIEAAIAAGRVEATANLLTGEEAQLVIGAIPLESLPHSVPTCGVSNPGGIPCAKPHGHSARGDVVHDEAAYGPLAESVNL